MGSPDGTSIGNHLQLTESQVLSLLTVDINSPLGLCASSALAVMIFPKKWWVLDHPNGWFTLRE